MNNNKKNELSSPLSSIAVIGATGTLGFIISKCLLNHPLFKQQYLLNIVVRRQSQQLTELIAKGAQAATLAEVAKNATMILVCTKPYDTLGVLEHINQASENNKNCIIICFAAGFTPELVNKKMGFEFATRFIWAMCGITVDTGGLLYVLFPPEIKQENILKVLRYISAKVIPIQSNNPDSLHIMTSAIGSGPAYIAIFLKFFKDTLIEVGIKPEEAQTIVQQTAQSTIAQLTAISPEEFIERVTTPNGGTAQGISQFHKTDWDNALTASTCHYKMIAEKINQEV